MQGILVELPLAGFFLKKLLRRGCDVNDMPTLDPELYRHLMLLREMSDPEQVDALALTFTISSSELDEHREVGALSFAVLCPSLPGFNAALSTSACPFASVSVLCCSL